MPIHTALRADDSALGVIADCMACCGVHWLAVGLTSRRVARRVAGLLASRVGARPLTRWVALGVRVRCQRRHRGRDHHRRRRLVGVVVVVWVVVAVGAPPPGRVVVAAVVVARVGPAPAEGVGQRLSILRLVVSSLLQEGGGLLPVHTRLAPFLIVVVLVLLQVLLSQRHLGSVSSHHPQAHHTGSRQPEQHAQPQHVKLHGQ
mmetsp:Transcript_41219/g.89846  ORF Transcript_41219/g.89846 Transcript_41219/m.89846 type:complete len:203 (+) Transcript_41219:674-1282(+)